jgi:hypothetical protein
VKRTNELFIVVKGIVEEGMLRYAELFVTE